MQTIRINSRLPQVARVCKLATPITTYIPTRKMSLFRRGAFPANDFDSFAPMFSLLDGYANHVLNNNNNNGRQGGSFGLSSSFKTFSPKFDVKENQDSYELHGELPGIEQKDVNIEFTDPQTLVVKGQTQHVREEGQRPSGLIEGEGEQGRITEGGEGENGYHKPTVEDENAAKAAEASKDGESSEVATQGQQQQPQQPQSRYWIREMSSGSFSRTFAFPTRVDQDSVKASLKNGILSIVVPKAQAPQSKRINIE